MHVDACMGGQNPPGNGYPVQKCWILPDLSWTKRMGRIFPKLEIIGLGSGIARI